jgi:hypothetical protein
MKNKNKKNKNTIDAEMVESWMGSEATLSDYAEVLADIANGDYEPSDLREEVSDYNDE